MKKEEKEGDKRIKKEVHLSGLEIGGVHWNAGKHILHDT